MNKEEAKKQIDEVISQLEWRRGGWTDYVKNYRTTVHAIIDKIETDHQKVKLPRDVGEELDDWMADNQYRLGAIIGNLILDMMTHEPKLTNAFDFASDSEENFFKIIDACRYGWEAEPEAKWYVKTPEAWESEDGDFGWLYKSIYGGVDTTSHGDGREDEQFTRAEIKLYHLDSDIFTLVPVGKLK